MANAVKDGVQVALLRLFRVFQLDGSGSGVARIGKILFFIGLSLFVEFQKICHGNVYLTENFDG